MVPMTNAGAMAGIFVNIAPALGTFNSLLRPPRPCKHLFMPDISMCRDILEGVFVLGLGLGVLASPGYSM